MTAETISRQVELIPGMTVAAIERGMNAPEFKATGLDMIENRILPLEFAMAGLAFGGKSQALMGRIGGGHVSLFMTSEADHRCTGKCRSVTGIAIDPGMGASQLKRLSMLEYDIAPARGNGQVAFPAVEAEISQAMVRIVGGVEIFNMAAFAIYRRSGEFIPALANMAGIAIGYSMKTQ